MLNFALDDFMEYMRIEFPGPMKYHFTYDLLRNTVSNLLDLCPDKESFTKKVCDIVPEVEKEEVLRFCPKKIVLVCEEVERE